jgi:hypothetical protein
MASSRLSDGALESDRSTRRPKCKACCGTGILAPARPSCEIPARRGPWVVVERCDDCKRFKDDLSAALSRYVVAGWFECCDGGSHALANSKSARRRSR